MKMDREPTPEERAELERIAAKYEAGTVTEEELKRAFLIEGYTEEWAAYLAKAGGFLRE